MLLAASYLFYMWWNPAYIILILFSTLINFYSSHAIERTFIKTQQKKKYLYLCLITNLGIYLSLNIMAYLHKPSWVLPIFLV